MKKAFSILLTLAMVLGLLPVAAMAAPGAWTDGAPTISISSSEVKDGSVAVTISVGASDKNVKAFGFGVNYDGTKVAPDQTKGGILKYDEIADDDVTVGIDTAAPLSDNFQVSLKDVDGQKIFFITDTKTGKAYGKDGFDVTFYFKTLENSGTADFSIAQGTETTGSGATINLFEVGNGDDTIAYPSTGNSVTVNLGTSASTQYTVKFVADGKTLSETKYDEGTAAKDVKVPTEPTKDGYKFTGWDKAVADVTADATYTAQFEKNPETKQYTVTFDTNGKGTAPEAAAVAENAKVAKPDDPTATGFKFDGWYTDKEWTTAYDFETPVTADITLYAKWTEVATYTVTFDANGHGTAPDALTVNEGDKAEAPTAPSASGFSFGGWYTDKECKTEYDFDTAVTADITLYAMWTKASSSSSSGGFTRVTVSKDATENGTLTISSTTPVEGSKVTVTAKPAEGYKLDTLTVTNVKTNAAVKVTDNGDGTFTFTAPSNSVKVGATFVKGEGTTPTDPTTPTTPDKTSFVDVPKDAWFAPAVDWAVEKGVTNGTSATTFSPNADLTRGQAVTFLWRLMGQPASTGANPFEDVSANDYYYDAVVWAVDLGVTKGTSDVTFSPSDTVTRGQLVTFIYRLLEEPAVGQDNPFSDVDSSAYYGNAVIWAAENGIVQGYPDGTFKPGNDITRAEMVTVLNKGASLAGIA